MKKSVTIRKANPGETPGYYNTTASFLNKVMVVLLGFSYVNVGHTIPQR